MLLGYNTNGFAHHTLEDALHILAELGYQSVAITLDHHALNPYETGFRRQLRHVRSLLTRLKLRSVIETGSRFLLNPLRKHRPTLVDTPQQAAKRMDFLRQAVDIASELESDAVSFWSGATEPDTPERIQWKRLLDGCRKIADYAGSKGVRLAFEPEPGMFVDTMTRYAALHDKVQHPAFGLTLDVGHLHCQGEVPIADHLRRWQAQLWNIHIEDMRRGVHDHLMFGEGEMEFQPIMRTLREIRYNGPVHVELSRHSHNAVETAQRAIEYLRQLTTDNYHVSPIRLR
ncbi:MAG TPA: sugar phosphate isomerase/epimerase family protein [Gemmataceae bacterium]|nr:sugar phosphate isomerase/epimerase family protein [Gemmataceae bacterium]